MSAASHHGWAWAIVCATLLMSVSAAEAVEPATFSTFVAQGYREMAFFALNQAGDPALAARFAANAEAAELRGCIEPAMPTDRELDRKVAIEARSARNELVVRLEDGAQWNAPLTSAIALLNFDCWVGLAVGAPSSSAECRHRFLEALHALPTQASATPAESTMLGTTTLIALQACAAPPWLGDCPTPRMAIPGRSNANPTMERHAGLNSATVRIVSALGRGSADDLANRPRAISALAEPDAPAAAEGNGEQPRAESLAAVIDLEAVASVPEE